MQVSDKQVDSLRLIFGEAAKNPLGTLALMTILIGILAYLFFGTTKPTPKSAALLLKVRLAAFLLVFFGTCAFGWAVVLTFPNATSSGTAGPAPRPSNPAPVSLKPTLERPYLVHTPNPAPRTIPDVAQGDFQGDFRTALKYASAYEGGPNVPGNMPQACQSYAKALGLVYRSLTPEERDLVKTSESQCQKGRSRDLVAQLKAVVKQFEPQTPQRE